MKRSIYVIGMIIIVSICNVMAQPTVNNGGFENWQSLGTNNEEPNDWNAFMTASGTLSSFGGHQITRSSVIRPGSSGTYSALIWSRLVITTVANGVMTTGQVNMGAMSPSDPANYNITHTANADFSEALGDTPDTVVFWVRFKPASGGSEMARMSAIIHDTYDYRDPTTGDVNGPAHVMATAALDFPKTNGLWERKAVLINYTGPAVSPDFILITFTTNNTPGGGSAADSLYIDDVELIYNIIDTTGMSEQNNSSMFSVYFNLVSKKLSVNMKFNQPSYTKISIFDITGKLIRTGDNETGIGKEMINLEGISKGMYFVKVTRADGYDFSKKFVIN